MGFGVTDQAETVKKGQLFGVRGGGGLGHCCRESVLIVFSLDK